VTGDDAAEDVARAAESGGAADPGPTGGGPDQPLDREAAALLGHEAGRGRPLPPDVAASVGAPDLAGDVHIHTSPAAQGLAAGLGARAFTVGSDVYFGRGGYDPGSTEGRSVLRHELAHVVQQAQGPPRIQRLLRTPFPWHGVVTSSVGANLRSAPDSSDPANVVRGLPRGSAVEVIGSTGLWLHVREAGSGKVVTGYVHHTLVDEASSEALAGMVGTRLSWKPSGPSSGTTFQLWASAASESPFPAVGPGTLINCWEVVLLAAHRGGALPWSRIHTLYTATPFASWQATLTTGPVRRYGGKAPVTPPQRGDLVFFDGLAHVALATGKGSEVYTFWPPPDTPFKPGATEDRVKVFTIEDLVTWWTANFGKAPVVEIGAPSW
jgi:hypothetical protein